MAGSNKYIVNTDRLAEILGKTRQRVNQLAREGVLPKQAPGKWDLVQTTKAYIAYLENGRDKSSGDLEKEKLTAEVRFKDARASTAELELAELQGKMHRSEDVASMTEELVYTVRSAMTALPGRLATDLAPMTKPAEISEHIRLEVNSALQALSEFRYDPAKYRERVMERAGWEKYRQEDGEDET